MKIGIDIDGVLADFNRAFIQRCIDVTGRDLFGPDYVPTTWNYPESLGYTSDEVSKVWAGIKADQHFWLNLPQYSTTQDDLYVLSRRIVRGDDVYFITARPGVRAKRQTELWLRARCTFVSFLPIHPTVLITSHKGLAVQTLGLDYYIDDRWENCLDAAGVHWAGKPPLCKVFIMDRPWNQSAPWQDEHNGLTRVSSVAEMLSTIETGTKAAA